MTDMRYYTLIHINNDLIIKPYWEKQDIIDTVKKDIYYNEGGVCLFVRVGESGVINEIITKLNTEFNDIRFCYLVSTVYKSKTEYYKKGMEFSRGTQRFERGVVHICGASKTELEAFLIKIQFEYNKRLKNTQIEQFLKFVCLDTTNDDDTLKIDNLIVKMIEDTNEYEPLGTVDYSGIRSKNTRNKLIQCKTFVFCLNGTDSVAYVNKPYHIDDKHIKYEILDSLIKQHPDECKKYIGGTEVDAILQEGNYETF